MTNYFQYGKIRSWGGQVPILEGVKMKTKVKTVAPVIVSVKNKRWTDADIARFGRLLRAGKTYADLSTVFGRSEGNLAQAARNFRLKGIDIPMGQRGAPKKVYDISAINAEINK